MMRIKSKIHKLKYLSLLGPFGIVNYFLWKKRPLQKLEQDGLSLGDTVFENCPYAEEDKELLLQLSDNFMKHRFNVLGTGWITVQLEKAEALEHQNKIIQAYEYLDWHTDFISGYRWELKPSLSVIRAPEASDIKIPWEFGRCYHLPIMAQTYAINSDDEYRVEFKNQIYDFISQNPVGKGVQWNCAMEVSLRVANWIMAYDLFVHGGAEFEENFQSDFAQTIYQHGEFIINNLEWTYIARSNHYLSNLLGLACVAAKLKSNETIDQWLHLCFHELKDEFDFQFYDEGSNYEGSVSYHRLSTEIIYWTYKVLDNLSKERKEKVKGTSGQKISHPKFKQIPKTDKLIFPPKFLTKLCRSVEFCKNTLKPSGEFVQVGDNDSGRVFKVYPDYDSQINENTLSMKSSLRQLLVPSKKYEQDFKRTSDISSLNSFKKKLRDSKNINKYIWTINKADGGKMFIYKEFGLVIYSSSELWLSFRCGAPGQNGVAGHDHNDQLSLELSISGEDKICDPGSYTYTAHPKLRNKYRSVSAHFAPQLESGEEPGDISEGLFEIHNPAHGELLFCDKDNILGRHKAYGEYVYRWIEITESKLIVTDYIEGSLKLKKLKLIDGKYQAVQKSSGYGVIK